MDKYVRAKPCASELFLRTDFILHSQDSGSLLLPSEPDELLCIAILVCIFMDSNTQPLHFHAPILSPCTCFEPHLTRPPFPMSRLSETCHAIHPSTEKRPCEDSVELAVSLPQLLVPATQRRKEIRPCSSARANQHDSSEREGSSRDIP